MIALSIHSILEGVAIGLADTPEDVVTLFLSVILHEVIYNIHEVAYITTQVVYMR